MKTILLSIAISVGLYGQSTTSTYIYRATTTAPITSSDTVIPVSTTEGFAAGMKLRMGTSTEEATVQSVGATSITVARGSNASGYGQGVGILALLSGTVDGLASYVTGSVQLPPNTCIQSVSGNATGTNGPTIVAGIPVVQAQTSIVGTNQHRYDCTVLLPMRATERLYVTSVAFTYGVQGSNLAAGSASLANGTINGATVFTFQDASLAGESSALARADSGSIAIAPSPVNLAVGTAGKWYTIRVTPGKPIPFTQGRVLQFTIVLQCAATSATITYTRGLQVNYASQ